MKKLHIAGNLLKVMLLGSLLAGCQNDEIVSPTGRASASENLSNAKTTAELKLIKQGLTNIQYITSGRQIGKISKVSEPYYYTNYSYDENATGELWITSKRYHKATNTLDKEIKYKIVNGHCLTSIDVTSGWTSEYKYNESWRLDEINLSKGALTQKRVFKYDYSQSADAERLTKITSSTPAGAYEEVTFTYTLGMNGVKKDKYGLNNELTGLDPYLTYFGKFSDGLVQQAQISPLPYNGQAKPYYRYYYSLDADGYATSRNKEYFPLGYGNETNKQGFYTDYKYSTNWQGL